MKPLKRFIKPLLLLAVGVLIGSRFSASAITPWFGPRLRSSAYPATKSNSRTKPGKLPPTPTTARVSWPTAWTAISPRRTDTFNFFYAKTFHGIKDIVASTSPAKNTIIGRRTGKRPTLPSKTNSAKKCHRNILLYIPINGGGPCWLIGTVLYARPGYEKKCVDCHRNLVHVPRP